VLAAVLIEPEGDPKKVLRVTVPLGMQAQHGTRAIIDQGQPATAPYVVCFANGCMADYEANADMVKQLKRGQQLAVQAIHSDGKPLSLTLPIGGEFAKAHEGSPTDPKVFEAQQKKLQEELERQAAASGKKMDRALGVSTGAANTTSVNLGNLTNLIYSPWTKVCLKGREANAKQVCFTGKDARSEAGQPVLAAVLIEPEGDPKKVLRVTVPLGMQMKQGTRAIIDKGQPALGAYVTCFTNGCMADYEANAEMINRLKRGRQLAVQTIHLDGKPLSLTLPIGGEFAKAHEGSPTDSKVFEAQQKKLQEALDQQRAASGR
jgi:invasion protein IalB